tara:strand:+ start:1914 stop:2363 length:450 start_codon:yes stop_codon:yes gene_type:complete
MSEIGVNLELSDKQREDVRKMLEKYSGKKTTQQQQQNLQQHDKIQLDPDPLELAKPGETVDWTQLTPKTRRYAFVKETRSQFVPRILDQILVTKEELEILITGTGADITSQNDALTVCSITQADPIRVFQIETRPKDNKILIETIRYIV